MAERALLEYTVVPILLWQMGMPLFCRDSKKDPLRLEKQEGIYRLLVGPEMRKFWRSRWKDATDASIFHLSKRNLTRITIWFKWRRSVKFNLRTFDSKHFCFPFECNHFVNILHEYLDSKCIFYTRNWWCLFKTKGLFKRLFLSFLLLLSLDSLKTAGTNYVSAVHILCKWL